jgi:hypothetical protein
MNATTIRQAVTLTSVTCCSCSVLFAMPEVLRARLQRDGGSFYCPNGHAQHFTQSETTRLRAKLDEAMRTNTQLAADLAAEQRERARITKRVSAGVCPCCNRSFANLARHMASKHKGA